MGSSWLRLFFTAVALASRAAPQDSGAAVDCPFTTHPDRFLARESHARREVADRIAKLDRALALRSPALAASADEIPIRNLIDEEIFGKLRSQGVASASLSSDQEFVRRIHLDLTGRIPSPEDIRTFVDDASPSKRDDLIDRLLFTPEFEDRWTMWLGDLLQNTTASSNINRQVAGRDAFYNWIRSSIISQKSFRDIAIEAVTASGNTFDALTGAANFPLSSTTPGGPIQDTYDTMLAKTAATFLGLAHYDCLLCHNGRGHLDQINLWAGRTTRAEAEMMAAFFARQRLARVPVQQSDPLYNSYDVSDAAAGTYDLNTGFGNRPNRVPIGTMRNLTPQYRLGNAPPAGAVWRAAFAANMVEDPMFARNIVNRLWKHFFGLGLVDPVDTMDPARLDASNPPPAPWTLQATHPELLERLAQQFRESYFNFREFIRLLVQSSAYQLSSRYPGEWKFEYVTLFARHYPRRLEAEEVADAISKATGMPGNYTVTGWSTPVAWAMQTPEPAEPRGAAGSFMSAFFRGNRDTQQRSQSGSILQQLGLMNDPFVLNRTRVAASPALQAVSRMASDDAAVERLFLLFLSRQPSDYERGRALAFLHKATTPATRSAAIEDLAWACINKLDFLFSY